MTARERQETTPPRPPTTLHFAPYRLDVEAERLWCGERAIPLRPKTWAVLRYLAERPGELVTKEQLLDVVWAGIAVGEGTLTKSVGEIREALDDDPRNPRFLETVHRRGFRFLVPTRKFDTPPANPAAGLEPLVVGRDGELRRLQTHLALAEAAVRQVVFIAGEAGIGKTTLVESFLASLEESRQGGTLWIASGHCLRHLAGHEPYMAVLDALGRVARGPHGDALLRLLRERAPSWLMQLPWLLSPQELDELRSRLAGTTSERMLRVFAQLVESLPTGVTLVLVLEDLQWADASTLDLLSALARRPDPARVLVLATYRPAEVIVHQQALDRLRRELAQGRLSGELALELLSCADIERYLGARFGTGGAPPELVRLLHTHSDGNPLFLVTAVDTLLARGWVEHTNDALEVRATLEELERHIPSSLAELVGTRVQELDPSAIAVLEAGSVAGISFPAQAAAAAVGDPIERVEDVCESLVRSHHVLRPDGSVSWSDGSVGVTYAFTHAVYQRALYDRIPPARRRLLHQRIGERLEAGWGPRVAEVAHQLALHFEESRDAARAIHYLSAAADGAQRRFAPREAAELLRRALALLDSMPASVERRRLEFELRFALGVAAQSRGGFPVDEVRINFARVRELATDDTDPVQIFRILFALHAHHLTRGDVGITRELANELARTAERMQNEHARVVADFAVGFTALWEGHYQDAERLGRLGAFGVGPLADFACGVDPALDGMGANSWRLWLVGYPDQALEVALRCVTLARRQPSPAPLATALFFAANVNVWCGRLEQAETCLHEGRTLADGLPFWSAGLTGSHGALLMRRGQPAAALREISRALDELRSFGQVVHLPSLLAGLGEALLASGRVTDGRNAVDEGLHLVATKLDQTHAAELWRVRALLAAAEGSPSEQVSGLFLRAVDIARSQGARAFELRAATSLARHLAANGRRAEARAVLGPVYGTFAEGLATADPTEARLLLQTLAD